MWSGGEAPPHLHDGGAPLAQEIRGVLTRPDKAAHVVALILRRGRVTRLETICGWQASAGIDARKEALTRALRTTCLPSVPVPPITKIEFLAIPVSARMQRVVRPEDWAVG